MKYNIFNLLKIKILLDKSNPGQNISDHLKLLKHFVGVFET